MCVHTVLEGCECGCKVGKLRYVRRMPQSIMVRRPRGQGGECSGASRGAPNYPPLPHAHSPAQPPLSHCCCRRASEILSAAGDLSDKRRSALTFDYSTGALIAGEPKDDHFALLGNAQPINSCGLLLCGR